MHQTRKNHPTRRKDLDAVARAIADAYRAGASIASLARQHQSTCDSIVIRLCDEGVELRQEDRVVTTVWIDSPIRPAVAVSNTGYLPVGPSRARGCAGRQP